ncbi:hypothetical protein C8Q75DRAFT_743074 [Abortiporus biennis]|nr:hypothetical protein C8Q75DRAFT_743074 [Abortiporus biennis]
MTFSNIRSTWLGLQNIKYLIIFGDSYSAINAVPLVSFRNLRPTPDKPLGVDFPGTTYNEPDLPNWVGYLITEYVKDHQLLVYDYAAGGNTVSGVMNQIDRFFMPTVGQKPEYAPWTDTDALFITWIGINDLAYISKDGQMEKSIKKLFLYQEKLYDNGARNFLFIDVPPINRAPAMPQDFEVEKASSFINWNTCLKQHITEFSSTHPDITTMIFSAYDLFNDILDNPEEHGFPKEDVRKSKGSIWFDHLHPTSKTHKEIARAVFQYLLSQAPHESTQTGP